MTQTIEQFGQTIKAKYPQYSDMSDADLGQKMLTKYPQYGDMVSTAPAQPQGPTAGGFLKGLVSAPATMIARPFQAGAELLGASPESVDKFSNNISGGLIAPVPQNGSDVVKDVGRGVETVAFGTGAPMAGGAAFGFGNALEQQGSDALTTPGGIANTALQTGIGMGTGKLLDLVGKPLLNAAGKVVGTITPKILQDVTAKGAGAVADFMAQHEILPKIASDVVNKIPAAAESFDNAVNKGTKSLFSKTGNVVTSQYPALSKESRLASYKSANAEDIAKPTTIPKASYNKATEIYNNAKAQGTDLGQVATDNKIIHNDITDGKVYDTKDTAENLRRDAMKTSHDLLRPNLTAAEGGVARVPLSDIRNQMLSEVDNIPKSQITDGDRAVMKKQIASQYSDTSAAAKAHPDGYSLTDLHDAKISTGANAKYNFAGSTADNLGAKRSGYESSVFRRTLERVAPPELNVGEFNKRLQDKFQLADYLEQLHGKATPISNFRKAAIFGGKLAGTGLGTGLGGGLLGGSAGYHMGGVLLDSFTNMSNPLKAAALREMEATQPEVFAAFKKQLGAANTENLLRLKLPAGNPATANYPAIPLGPKTPAPVNTIGNDIQQNSRRLFNTKELPAPEPRTIVPNTQGTPNKIGRYYSPGGDQGEVGGMRQRIKPKK